MNTYRIEGLTKTFAGKSGGVRALDNISLEIAAGELLVLLGPSGCGKTTAMRCVAGFETANEGRITFGDRTVFDAQAGIDVPPERRNVGMVFQSYALWPHKTVRENIAYPLKVRGLRQGLDQNWVEEAARLVDCVPLLDRYPAQLSGGQQQRVALARGIVARPDMLLFDEPLSNLDALLRGQVRNDLHELHRRLGFSGIYVTHDQAEAFAIGDRVAVMQLGRLEQVGTPQDVYERPATDYVANFVGMTNSIDLLHTDGGWRTASGHVVPAPVPPSQERVRLRFRPAAAAATAASLPAEGLRLPARHVDSVYAGGQYEMSVEHAGARMGALATSGLAASVNRNDPLWLTVQMDQCAWFDADGRRLPTVFG